MARQRSRHKARQFVLSYLKGKRCIDCGEDRLAALSFDHVRGRKRACISRMIVNGCSPETIAREIAKTEVRCVNCHFIKTARERGYLKATFQFGERR